MYMYSFNILQTVVSRVYAFFNTFFDHALHYYFIPRFELMTELLFSVFERWYYIWLMAFMGLLDLVQLATTALTGGRKVIYDGKEDYFINVILFNSGITRAVWGIILIAMALGIMLSLFPVLKAMASDEKGHIGKVMIKTSKIMLLFLVIPMIALASINFSMLILDKTGEMIGVANRFPSQTRVSSMVFLVATAGAQRHKIYEPSGKASNYRDEARTQYVTTHKNGRYYWNLFMVQYDFLFSRMNFLPAIIAAGFFIYVYLNIAIVFAFFLFQIVLLFIVSPFFVAAMAVDEGRMYKKWRDLFLTKIIAGLGLIASVRLYETIVLPLLISDTIRFMPVNPNVNDLLGPEYFPDIIFKMILLILFGRAVCKSHKIVTFIINEEAAQDEAQVADFVKKAGIAAAKAAIDIAIIAVAVVAGIFTAGAGAGAVGGAAGAAKGAAVAAKAGVAAGKTAAATAGKAAAKQVAKQAVKKAAKEVGKKAKDAIVDKGMSQISDVAGKVTGAGNEEQKQ